MVSQANRPVLGCRSLVMRPNSSGGLKRAMLRAALEQLSPHVSGVTAYHYWKERRLEQ